ncbi:MAG: class I SAM-dependent methyltransferase [Deltaproteobacteria bacterium]|nr:class I SAM-dependent methyltransferase [Candidatus Anaeroferrophillus wilburensis]MBN2888869.1 class I SAM-dependent methyltransferase [Deltaproteobacteria bacterium]
MDMVPLKQLVHSLASRYTSEPLTVIFWDGDKREYGPGEADQANRCTLRFHNKKAVQQTFFRGSLGFGEAYMAGDIDVFGNLQQVIKLGLEPAYESCQLPGLARLSSLRGSLSNFNSAKGARQAIPFHYDRGNDFYQEWLDESMTYSCAYFKDPHQSLEKAQEDKYEHICRKLQLQPGDRLVDIGCGWGGMLIYAATHYRISGTGYTLSRNQLDHARDWARRAGVDDRITFHLQDYRDATGTYDKVVSIGMFEHVGRKYYSTFFDQAKKLLKPGGIGLLHTIGKNDGSGTDAWITTYIFPGGELPQLYDICRFMGTADLDILEVENLRRHYHLTLEHWIKRFESKLQPIRALFKEDPDAVEQFIRCWRLYLNGSSVNFLHGNLNLYQLTFTRGLVNDLPLTRSHIYH